MRCQLDHERLDVYQVELAFVAWSTDLMVEFLESPEANDRFSPHDQVREEHVEYGIEDDVSRVAIT